MSDEIRVVLIKPGDRLIIGGIEYCEVEDLRAMAERLQALGFPAVAFVEGDASIAATKIDTGE